MHPAFKSIVFGPFATNYHRAAVDEAFREALSRYLETELLPQLDEPFENTTGRLTARFNDEKFCGPKSAVRDAYLLEFSFLRKDGADEIKAELYRDPTSGSFRPRYKGQPLILWTAKRKADQAAFHTSIDAIVNQVLRGESQDLHCPKCALPLRITDSPALFDVSCPAGCFTVNYHRDPTTRAFLHGHRFIR